MLANLRLAFRHFIKSPGFSLAAVLALALGIGANTAMFSIINTLFLRPLPFAQPRRIVQLTSSLPGGQLTNAPFSYPRYLAVRDAQTVFSDLTVGTFTAFNVTGRGDPEQVQGFHAAANFLHTLGLQPELGRFFSSTEDRPGGPPVVLLSQAYWRKKFNGDRGVLGQTLTLDGRPNTIIGVLPAALSQFPFDQTDLWVPRPAETSLLVPAQLNHGAFGFQVIARLRPGVSLAQAREAVNVLAAGYRAANPKNIDAPSSAETNLLLDDLVGNQRPTFIALFGAVGCVLLIACANVANLLLARFASRRKEIAVRFALGASRGRVIRQFLVESLLLAVLGAGAGLLFAQWAIEVFLKIGQAFIPRALEISLDPVVLAFTAGLALLTGLATGIVPAWQAARPDVNEALKSGARGSSGGARENRFRHGLLVGEIALSLVLLVSASLLLASFSRLSAVAPGFTAAGVFVGGLNPPPARYASAPALADYYRRVLDRVAALPGVKSAALNDALPLSGATPQAPVAVVGRPVPPLSEQALALRHLVSPGLFQTLGIGLKSGRDFDQRDNPAAPPVVIINETMARHYFPDGAPLGQKLITGMGQLTAEVIGVVADNQSNDLTSPPVAEYFLPVLQRPENFTSLIVRAAGDPVALTGAIRTALKEVDPDLPLLNPTTLPLVVARTGADRRLIMVLLAAFAGLAVVLASIGIYSVMAYVVTQRSTELGIRMALGASPAMVQRLVVAQGLKVAAVGIAVGIAAALGFTRLLQTFLFGVRPGDPQIYAGISLLVAGVTYCACWIPARRAARVDPLVALRSE
ncbi:MAG: ABC transporter permease [Opitutae bacterium]|nr:ABC transporter permease [Opitutae bacterium]